MSEEVYIIEEDKPNKSSELILRSKICMYPPRVSIFPEKNFHFGNGMIRKFVA